ncbi:hypothetical protein JVT61DRAFT_499 [Boletus reticuloceps]|uniref:Uncharacterized protein n=1 Tax=Boletus reticuloceps TaxID=495285 RepID=A0A8I2Z1S4_9AGAM|nr:hypothetical protein JVT61DRAFT_499 [Boletus reticuloceps]
MEARTIQAFLRVLYTVNNNPQYILAKSSSQVPAAICNETTTLSATNYLAFARAPLKACLSAVCDSSPELLQDPARDFSLYVLDPLEAQPLPTSLSHPSNNTSSPRGVAVALGLMSWALESNDSMNVFVTGTIIPNASPALEIVFALRETKRVPKPMLHSYLSLGPISAPGSSHPLDPPRPPHAAGMNRLSTSHVQRDQQERQTLTRSADFPELYIGPPRRAPGRPEGSTSSKSRVKSQGSTSSLPGMSSSKGVETRSESKQQVGRSSKPKTRSRPPRAPPTHSPFVCGPLTRHTATGGPEAGATGAAAHYQQSHPFSQNQTQPHSQLHPQTEPYSHSTQNLLLGLLSAIPFTSPSDTVANTTPEQQAVFLSALQGLLANPHLLQLATTSTGLSASSGQKTVENKPVCGGSNADDDADSDIVILDSSTIDTTVFRKPNHRQLNASANDTTSQESPMPSGEGTDLSPLPASTPPSGQEDAPASSQTLTPSVTPKAETPTLKYASVGRAERSNETSLHALDMPATPTPSRARKRKLDEYIQGEAQFSTPTSPPSPSPFASRTSNPGRALTTRRVLSSPTRRRKLVSSPTVRLPSMMDSMRSTATSGSRVHVSSSSFSTHGRSASLATNKNADQSSMLGSGPSKPKGDHPEIMTAPSNIASGKTSLKRRLNLNLNEFMEEREARKHTKVRKRPSSGRKSEAEGSNASQAGPSLSANLVSTSRHAQSSPSRPFFRSHAVASSPPSAYQPLSVLGAAVSSPVLLSATTSTSTAPNPLKNFVLPAWARTSTAMLPRLSDEVLARQRAEREAKEAQISLRRREAAKAKRRRLRAAERLSNESSDEDDAVANDPIPRTLQLSSIVTRSAPLMAPPQPSLPVFASDAVEPIPSSPPQSHQHPVPSVAPSTPPRKSLPPGSASCRTPGSCSLFTPSGQDPESLFTPSTLSVTPSFTRVTFTPHSPTLFHRSGARKSPRKSVPQTPWTPKRNSINNQTPRSSRSSRNAPFVSPNLAMRPPQSWTGMGTRAFLLPPSSPCMSRMPHRQNQMRSEVPEASAPIVPGDSGIVRQEPPSEKQSVEKGIDVLGCEMKEALLEENPSIPPVQCSPTRLIGDDNQETNELRDIASNGDGSQVGEEYASSPLPPSSPLPCSPSSSPARHHDSDFDTPTINNFVVPDSDILLPSASDSDAPRGPADTTWLSDDACATSWFTDPEASAWLTETEAWLTDTEGGGPLLTDSDGAWLSDSDAIFGDMSSLPPSSASNWLSDDADVDTDGEVGQGQGQGQDGGFDTAAFERAFAALVERGGRSIGSNDKGGGGSSGATTGTHGTGEVEPEFWASMQPLLGANLALEDASLGAMTGGAVDTNDKDKVVQDIQG